MGDEEKTRKKSKIDTINELKALWEDNPERTREQLAIISGYSVNYVDSLWQYIIGHRSTDELVSQNYIMSVRPDENKAEKTIAGAIQIPDFVPKPKKFIDRNGKECTDVSEFFGITEYGGECYKDVHYTIPKGRVDLRGEIYENGIME